MSETAASPAVTEDSEDISRKNEVSLVFGCIALQAELTHRGSDEPVLVQQVAGLASPREFGLPVLDQRAVVQSSAGQPFRLDPERLTKVRQDDVAATKLLSALFSDTSELVPPASVPTVHVDPARALLPTLDDDHFQLLNSLLYAEDWNRERLQEAASQLGLMLDGALEVINDAALDLTGRPLVLYDCGLEVDVAIAREIVGAMAASMRAIL